MGHWHGPVILHNTRELVMARLGHLDDAQVHTVETEALVDTGAMHLVIPDTLAGQLGLLRLRTQALVMADGRDGLYAQTEPVTIEVLGRAFDVSAVVMGQTVLLGAIILEGLDLAVDCTRGTLMPNLGTWDQPLFRA
jgi:clan AA aspartic protease